MVGPTELTEIEVCGKFYWVVYDEAARRAWARGPVPGAGQAGFRGYVKNSEVEDVSPEDAPGEVRERLEAILSSK